MGNEDLAQLAQRLNNLFQDVVQEDIPTSVVSMTGTEAANECGCDASSYPPVVRVVTLAGHPCPCGGTHVSSTAQLSGVHITKVKKKKNLYKVSYSIGAEAA